MKTGKLAEAKVHDQLSDLPCINVLYCILPLLICVFYGGLYS
jgi:hypothetical protein